jgi:hypothetical protein
MPEKESEFQTIFTRKTQLLIIGSKDETLLTLVFIGMPSRDGKKITVAVLRLFFL